MSKTLVLVTYAASVNQSAGQGGPANRALTLQGVSSDARAKPPVAGPNDSLFDLPGAGRAQVTLTGLNEQAISGFKGGAKYKVTITEIHEAPASVPVPAPQPSTPAVSSTPSA